MFWVYLLRCADNTYYCGYTGDLEKRLFTHNAGRGGKYTRARLPVELIYSEKLPTRSAAMKKEAAVKKLSREKKEALFKKSF
ncbi:MAG: GIY-YIG nuclease family protein [archaeon]|jgi:putative endonuclease